VQVRGFLNMSLQQQHTSVGHAEGCPAKLWAGLVCGGAKKDGACCPWGEWCGTRHHLWCVTRVCDLDPPGDQTRMDAEVALSCQ
jgi:hypothetical protein